MSEFIQTHDYNATIHREILDTITRDDEAVVEICEDRAIDEMRSYLQGRYDCDAIFSARDDDRNKLILMMAIDITVYHIFSIHNPQKMSQLRVDRYNRAVEWMKAVAAGKISIANAPLLPEEDLKRNAPTLIQGNPLRDEHF